MAGGGSFANTPSPGTKPSLKSYLYAVRIRGTERIVPVLVFKTTRNIKAGDELTYVYSASFDPEPTLLAMPSCEDLSLYLKRMPHLNPDSVFGYTLVFGRAS